MLRPLRILRLIVALLLLQFIDPILNVTNKDVLTEEEVVQCQQVIYSIVALEARHEPLALPIGHR